jgi:hypothetical protein
MKFAAYRPSEAVFSFPAPGARRLIPQDLRGFQIARVGHAVYSCQIPRLQCGPAPIAQASPKHTFNER